MNSSSLKIVIYENFAAELAQALGPGHRLVTFKDANDATMANLLTDADALVWGAYKAAWRGSAGSALRLIHSTGAGVDGIDFAAVPPGCTVCNVYGHERGVAEHAFLLMLALQRSLFALDASLRNGDWTPTRPYLPELRGRSLLVLGLGHIGRELVRWGNFLEMKVTVLTRSPQKVRAHADAAAPRADGSLSDLPKFLPAADFVVVAIPATPETVDLVGTKEFELMKPTAFIINVGRGPVINEVALYTALHSRRIAGAGLDVWYQYPAPGQRRQPSQQPFHELNNVIMTPHKPTFETMAYRWREIAENLRRLARGEPLQSVVAPSA